MSSETQSKVTEFDNTHVFSGRVKWFNNKNGYGFITSCDDKNKDEDVFVHHSGVSVSEEQYKYLVQGEYVEFNIQKMDKGLPLEEQTMQLLFGAQKDRVS